MDEKERWGLFTLSSSTLVALTTWTTVVSMPLYIQIAGGILGIVSVILWGFGMFEGDLRRLRFSLALSALLFALTLLDQMWTRSVISEFPIQILAFTLILFNVEMIPLVMSHRRLHSGESISRSEDLARASWKIIRRKISTLGILFSGSYVLTITTIYIGLFVYSFAPIMGDTSIYLIVIFVLLALFITLKEGSQIDRAHHEGLEAN